MTLNKNNTISSHLIFNNREQRRDSFFGIPKLQGIILRWGNDHNSDSETLLSDVYKSSYLTTLNS